MRYVEGTPFGSRGGLAVIHNFPADGDYVFKAMLQRTISGELFGNTGIAMAGSNELLEISVNGDRVAVLEVHGEHERRRREGLRRSTRRRSTSRPGRSASPSAFVPRFVGPVDDLMMPIDHTLVDMRIGTGFGITVAAAHPGRRDCRPDEGHRHLRHAEPPARLRVPAHGGRRRARRAPPTPCAGWPTQAFRGPVSAADLADLMKFYDQGRKDGDFESGIRMAVQGILAQPAVPVPRRARARHRHGAAAYRVSDIELASRLSFFLWGTVPDAELIKAATAGTLQDHRRAREAGARACSPTRKAEALATRFGVAVAAPAGRREGAARRHPLSRSGTSRSPTRCARRPSSSSPAWCARTAACSTCSTPTTPTSTSAWRATTASPTCTGADVPARHACRRRAAACSRRAAS